jgi:hypothetical protein
MSSPRSARCSLLFASSIVITSHPRCDD